MRRLPLFLAILDVVICSCPPGFELVSNGQCRGKYATMDLIWDERAVNTAIHKCGEIDANPVIIHNSEQQAYWRSRGYDTLISIICAAGSTTWTWTDMSPIDYKPASYDSALNQKCKGGCTWQVQADDKWAMICNSKDTYTTDIWCTTQLDQPHSDDDCESFEDDNQDGICYQIGATVETYEQAQKTCDSFYAAPASIHNDKENSFIRRLAVSKGIVSGVFLGATSTDNGKNFAWTDGSEWNYTNFYPGFPMSGLGECLSMDTQSTAGEWVNTDCSSKFAVACQRKQHYTTPACLSGPWVEGDLIYSPGFPVNAAVPCDFILSVDAGKKVQVEILLLEANSCCDRLVIGDNYIGGTVIATLTGEINDKKYTTTTSNFMRVSWQPNGGYNVRGLIMTFRAV